MCAVRRTFIRSNKSKGLGTFIKIDCNKIQLFVFDSISAIFTSERLLSACSVLDLAFGNYIWQRIKWWYHHEIGDEFQIQIFSNRNQLRLISAQSTISTNDCWYCYFYWLLRVVVCVRSFGNTKLSHNNAQILQLSTFSLGVLLIQLIFLAYASSNGEHHITCADGNGQQNALDDSQNRREYHLHRTKSIH